MQIYDINKNHMYPHVKYSFAIHFQQLANILKDPEASKNDRYVALEFLKNANIAAGMILPGCQDTGTAIIMGKIFSRAIPCIYFGAYVI